ncbi:MAG: hypothetical protein JWP78_996 [Mucilaginibacter sp.]|nr:hypothetical protein [Mucilaginibacter sp.]
MSEKLRDKAGMKKVLHSLLKLLLALVIFLGLQGRVIIRYSEIFHKNQKSELMHSEATGFKEAISHCKLQCYTTYFRYLDVVPLVTFLLISIIGFLSHDLLYIFFKKKLFLADLIRLLPLRAPPVF